MLKLIVLIKVLIVLILGLIDLNLIVLNLRFNIRFNNKSSLKTNACTIKDSAIVKIMLMHVLAKMISLLKIMLMRVLALLKM